MNPSPGFVKQKIRWQAAIDMADQDHSDARSVPLFTTAVFLLLLWYSLALAAGATEEIRMSKTIVFVTGTRADYGKLKPLIKVTEESDAFVPIIFATGMHTLERYGFTIDEIRANGHKKVYMYTNQVIEEGMDLILGNTIAGFSRFVRDVKPDLIVIHGDRLEALAGASVGALAGIPVAHIEGGEVSGTVDESIRHAVSKLSHIHLVASSDAAQRLRQLGEETERIHIIGSPEIDVMLSPELPSLDQACARYEISFRDYGIGIFHPVTTELETIAEQAENYVQALLETDDNYILIYPNNDIGSSVILNCMRRLSGNKRFRIFPSLRFEYFLTILRNARYIIGNSSAGVREAPVYGVPSIDLGTRQRGRATSASIRWAPLEKEAIAAAIRSVHESGPAIPSFSNGTGHSREAFLDLLRQGVPWDLPMQKRFQPLLSEEAKS